MASNEAKDKLEQPSWDSSLRYMFWATQRYETMPAVALVAKLAEETGEFAEAILNENGYLGHKDKTLEGPMGEAADIINVLIGALAVQYPEKTASELTDELYETIQNKWKKYERIINPK